MNHLERPPERGGLVLVGVFFAVSAALNLLTPRVLAAARGPGTPTILLGILLVGTVAGEAGLLAIWAVLGPQRLLVRWLASLLVTVVLWGVLLLGMALAHIPGGIAEIARGTLMLPLILLAVQSPLWILKMRTGWRIVLAGTQAPAVLAESRQFRLQHMLGATAVIAAAFGLAGLGLPPVDGPRPHADTSLWLGLMWACMMLYFLSALSIWPCLWAALVVRNKAAGAAAITIYVVLMSALVVLVIWAFSAPGPPIEGLLLLVPLSGPGPPIEGLLLLVPLLGGLEYTMLGGLHIARARGYVLVQPREEGTN